MEHRYILAYISFINKTEKWLKINTYGDRFIFKGGATITLPITKEQFEGSILSFVNTYKRLPYETEDDIEVKILNDNNELEIRPYKANRYIREYYKTQEKLTEILFDKKIISYKLVAEMLGFTETVIRNAITKRTKTINNGMRRGLEIFFCKDICGSESKYNNKCITCDADCKQAYFADIIRCPKFIKNSL